MRKIIAGLLTMLFAASAATPAYARGCQGVNMPNTIQVDGTQLTLNGMGIREATVLQVNVYVAGLYVETPSRDANAILNSDTKKRIVLHFVHNIDRDQAVEAAREGFRNNAPNAPAAKVNQFVSYLSAMREGQVMQYTYIPGRGTEVVVNGQVKGTIEGADMGRAIFSLYIGRRPPNAGLRTGLLGGRCG